MLNVEQKNIKKDNKTIDHEIMTLLKALREKEADAFISSLAMVVRDANEQGWNVDDLVSILNPFFSEEEIDGSGQLRSTIKQLFTELKTK